MTDLWLIPIWPLLGFLANAFFVGSSSLFFTVYFAFWPVPLR